MGPTLLCMLHILQTPNAALQLALGRCGVVWGEQLTFNGVHELVGCIHDLYETTAVAALGYLLSIPQHTTCNMHAHSHQDTDGGAW